MGIFDDLLKLLKEQKEGEKTSYGGHSITPNDVFSINGDEISATKPPDWAATVESTKPVLTPRYFTRTEADNLEQESALNKAATAHTVRALAFKNKMLHNDATVHAATRKHQAVVAAARLAKQGANVKLAGTLHDQRQISAGMGYGLEAHEEISTRRVDTTYQILRGL